MGYTHYWTQRRNFTVAQWQQIITDLRVIIDHAQHVEGIALGNGMGEGGTSPELTDDVISFNGVGDDSHETLYLTRKISKEPEYPGQRTDWGFCKTAHKPYDLVVTAVLAYVSTVTRKEDHDTHEPIIGSEAYNVSSDGFGRDWLAGVDLVRAALPRVGNLVDIPLDVMKSDRWCGPWVSLKGATGCEENKTYEAHFCIDGHGYVLKRRTGESYRFETHTDFALWLDKRKQWGNPNGPRTRTRWGSYGSFEPDIWRATGSFDTARHLRLKRAQERALAQLFPVPAEHAHQPPLFVRPGELPENAGREFAYSLNELLNKLEVA